MFTFTAHAAKMTHEKGFDVQAVLAAANLPSVTYDNGRHPGQRRHIRDGIVAVVDPAHQRIITVYKNVVETDARADQTDKDAKRYAARRGQKARMERKNK
jgi:hypothetical protein